MCCFLNIIHLIVVDFTVKLDSVYGATTFSRKTGSRIQWHGNAECLNVCAVLQNVILLIVVD